MHDTTRTKIWPSSKHARKLQVRCLKKIVVTPGVRKVLVTTYE